MAEDAIRIGKGYRSWGTGLLAALPVIVADFAEVKWVVAAAAFSLGVALYEANGRLHELCIRARRTKILLSQKAGS